MRFIDLCCGVGGFHMALERIGPCEVVLASDIDKKCRQVYHMNHQVVPVGDFTKLDVSSIPSFQGLTAGFPCQPFSYAGNRLGVEDSRGTVVYSIIKIIEHHLPEWLCLENVKGLQTSYIQHSDSSEKISVLDYIKDTISELGYVAYHRILSPHELNIPQFRERIIIIFVRKDHLRIPEEKFETKMESHLEKLIQERREKNHSYSIHDKKEKKSPYRISDIQRETLEMWNDFVSRPEWDTIDNQELNEVYTRVTGVKTKRNFKSSHFFTDFLDYRRDATIKKSLRGKTRGTTLSITFKKTSDMWNVLYHHHPGIQELVDRFLDKYASFIATLPLLYRYLEYSGGVSYGSNTSLKKMYAQFRPSGTRIRKSGIFPTLVKSGPRPILIGEGRTLTNYEMGQLQSFDPTFTFLDDKSAMSQCGNAVNVEVIELMLRSMFLTMKKSN